MFSYYTSYTISIYYDILMSFSLRALCEAPHALLAYMICVFTLVLAVEVIDRVDGVHRLHELKKGQQKKCLAQ